jgi:hypothetical protein
MTISALFHGILLAAMMVHIRGQHGNSTLQLTSSRLSSQQSADLVKPELKYPRDWATSPYITYTTPIQNNSTQTVEKRPSEGPVFDLSTREVREHTTRTKITKQGTETLRKESEKTTVYDPTRTQPLTTPRLSEQNSVEGLTKSLTHKSNTENHTIYFFLFVLLIAGNVSIVYICWIAALNKKRDKLCQGVGSWNSVSDERDLEKGSTRIERSTLFRKTTPQHQKPGQKRETQQSLRL